MKVTLFKLCFFVFILFSLNSGYAQLDVRSIGFNSNAKDKSIHQKSSLEDTIQLPFWDDFSFTDQMPTDSLWSSFNGVLINNTLSDSPPSMNVATFDGYNSLGYPYSTDGLLHDTTDMMTSRRIDLSVVKESKKDSVVFSFYWQKGGKTDLPEDEDLLVLQFRNAADQWVDQLTLVGDTILSEKFKKVSISLSSLSEDYFHSGFQFRFYAIGNTSGPYDAWHIDYVYLNQDRKLSETQENILDHTVAGPLTSIFGDYTKIPYDVFFKYPDTIFSVSEAEVFSLETAQDHQIDFEYRVSNVTETNGEQSKEELYHYLPIGIRNVGSLRSTIIEVDSAALTFSAFEGMDGDQMLIESEFIYKTNDGFFPTEVDVIDAGGQGTTEVKSYLEREDYNFRLNDTIRSYYEVHEALAYDDGSAELAAGINNAGAQLAVQYYIPMQDSITHVDIYFPAMQELDISTMYISIVTALNSEGVELVKKEFSVPGNANLNSFTSFEFDLPVILSGEFFVVFEQSTNFFVPIGLDMNSQIGKKVIHSKLEDAWEANDEIDGVLMIRPVFADSDYVIAGVRKGALDVAVYPNPTISHINIQGAFDNYQLFDITGSEMLSGMDSSIDVDQLTRGIYYLKIAIKDRSVIKKVILN